MMTLADYSVFAGRKLVGEGELEAVLVQARRVVPEGQRQDVLIFDNRSGRTLDVDLQGSEAEILQRVRVFLPKAAVEEGVRGPGRPKLGVVAREISLLPKHWEWLELQQGGASVTLRKLVEKASVVGTGASHMRQVRDRAYHFMTTIAGDLPGYEEALRAMYKDDTDGFALNMAAWPVDVREHALRLARVE